MVLPYIIGGAVAGATFLLGKAFQKPDSQGLEQTDITTINTNSFNTASFVFEPESNVSGLSIFQSNEPDVSPVSKKELKAEQGTSEGLINNKTLLIGGAVVGAFLLAREVVK